MPLPVIPRSDPPCHCEERPSLSSQGATAGNPLHCRGRPSDRLSSQGAPSLSLRGAERRSNLPSLLSQGAERPSYLDGNQIQLRDCFAKDARNDRSAICHPKERPSLSLRGAERRSNLPSLLSQGAERPSYLDGNQIQLRDCFAKDARNDRSAICHPEERPSLSSQGAPLPVIARSGATKQSPQSVIPRSGAPVVLGRQAISPILRHCEHHSVRRFFTSSNPAIRRQPNPHSFHNKGTNRWKIPCFGPVRS